MSDWTEGYVSDIGYISGYYPSLSPVLQRFTLLAGGFAPPSPTGNYLELGFGHGLSAVIHAAATLHPVWGTDFLPSFAANALSLAESAAIEVHLFDDGFAELDQRDDLPNFDFISAHGVWSWISGDNRQAISRLLRRRLAVGGICYLSYNTQPGWTATLPLRHLLTLHANLAGSSEQGIAGRIDAALTFAHRLAQNSIGYFHEIPSALKMLGEMTNSDHNVLAHEYFNKDWHPLPFSEVIESLKEAKLEFCLTSRLLDLVTDIDFPPEGYALLNSVRHPVLRQTARDLMLNTRHRRDLFMRGPRRLAATEQKELLLATPFALLHRPETVPLKITTNMGEIHLDKAIYIPLLEAMAANGHQPQTLGELWEKIPQASFPQILQAIILLAGTEVIHPAQTADTIDRVRGRVAALNRELCRRALNGAQFPGLASAVTGSGVGVSTMHQLFLSARAVGHESPADMASYVLTVLQSLGRSLLKDGQPLDDNAEPRAYLVREAVEFVDKRLPVLQSLAIAE